MERANHATRATLLSVTDFCTCGAQLPPDARFCHKCGKPQFEEAGEAETEPVSELPPPPPPVEFQPPPAAPRVGWKDPVTIRSAALAAALTSLLLPLPLPPGIQIIWQIGILVAGGFFSVYLYNKRTGTFLRPGRGAVLGWMSGLFCFLILFVLFTISVLILASNGGLQQSFRNLLEAQGQTGMDGELQAMLESPAGLAGLFAVMLFTSFLLVSTFTLIGGALGAKVLEKD